MVDCPFSFGAGDVSNEHDWHAILTNQPPNRDAINSDSDDEVTVTKKEKEEEEEKPFWVDILKYNFNGEDTLASQPDVVNPNKGLSVDEVVNINNQHGALRNQVDGLYYRIKGLLTQKMSGKGGENEKVKAQKECVEDLHRWAERKRQACQWSIAILTKISGFLNKLFDDLSSNWHSFGPGEHFYINADDLPDNDDEIATLDLFDDSETRKKIGTAEFKGHSLHGWLIGWYPNDSVIRKIGVFYNKGKKSKVYVWEEEQLMCMELYKEGKKTERVEFFLGSEYDVNSQSYMEADETTKLEMDDIRNSKKPVIKRVMRYLESDKEEEKKPVAVVEFNMLGDVLFVGEGVVEVKEKEYVTTPDEEKGMKFDYVKKSIDTKRMEATKYHYMRYLKVFENGKESKIYKLEKGKSIPNKGVVKRGTAAAIGGYYHTLWEEYQAGTMTDSSILHQTDYFTLFGILKCSVITKMDGTVVTERYTQCPTKPFMFTLSSGKSVKVKSFTSLKNDSDVLKL